jgi:multidrug efflux pump subunit AcrA (membrane-fusion protein)
MGSADRAGAPVRERDGQAKTASPGDAVEARFQLLPASPPAQGQAPPWPVPSPTGRPSLDAAQSPRRHRLPWPVLAFLLLLLLGAAAWWAVSSARWTLPWAQPAGPLIASGTLEADEVLVGAEVAGRIVELVQEGQAVGAGDLVARLDDSLLQVQLRQADLATRQRLEVQAEDYQLRSPISGIVTRVPMHRGEVVTPGQVVVAVADLTVLKLTVYVLEGDLGHVQVGQQVDVTADPFGERTFRGVVTSTNPRAEFTPRNVQTRRDRLNLVFGVNLLVDNPDGALKPGMPADASFPRRFE